MNVLTKIANLGVYQSLDQETIKRIRIVNQISILIFLLSVFTLTATYVLDFPRFAFILFLPFTIFSLIPPFLNKLGKTVLARLVLICYCCCILLAQAIAFGADMHFQFFLIAVVGAPPLLFDKEIGIYKWVLSFMTIPLWIYMEWHFVHVEPLIPLDPTAVYVQRLFNNLMLFSIVFFMFYVFTRQSNEHIGNIEKQRLAIETLLREVHHRVKNNLQVITSLLGLQSMGIKAPKIKNLFQDLQHRINSMALSHEMLYQTNNLLRIDYGDYIRKLITDLISSMKGPETTIDIQSNVEKVYLNIDTAIPLGLIINEVVTNSLKYAFKDDIGTITLHLKKLKSPNFLLEIGDNGVGFHETEIQKSTGSLGLTLIKKLTLQINGTIVKDSSKNGTHYIIHFQEITLKS